MLIPLLLVAGLGYWGFEHFKKKAPPMKVNIKLPPVLGGQTITVQKSPDSIINTLAQAANVAANAEQIKKNIGQIQHTVTDVQKVAGQIQQKQPEVRNLMTAISHVQNPAQAVPIVNQAVSTISDIASMFGEPKSNEFSGTRYKVKA